MRGGRADGAGTGRRRGGAAGGRGRRGASAAHLAEGEARGGGEVRVSPLHRQPAEEAAAARVGEAEDAAVRAAVVAAAVVGAAEVAGVVGAGAEEGARRAAVVAEVRGLRGPPLRDGLDEAGGRPPRDVPLGRLRLAARRRLERGRRGEEGGR